MWIQKSFQNHETGTLFLVPTPIGNLDDMTFRAIQKLKDVELIACEDTRQTKKLCNYFEIDTKLISYHEHNKEVSGNKLINDLLSGKDIALVSDAGMPAISDPGFEIVESCVMKQIPVVPLPGANAALPSLVASGQQTNHFYFYGFLQRQKKEKRKQLEEIKSISCPIIFYESPHRLKDTLHIMNEVLGDRTISVARELSKRYEEFLRGKLSEIISHYQNEEPRGEYCLVIEGASEVEKKVEDWWNALTIEQHIDYYIAQKLTSKEAIKQVAKERGVSKRDVYQVFHGL